jgi:PAS domain S-box-containing protein
MTKTTEAIRVLHVDDNPDISELTATFLKREDDRFTVETAPTISEGMAYLEESDIDCVVSDYDMPGENGIEFLETVRETHPDLPFVLFTGKGSEEVASEAISAGVTDYLQKESGTSQYTVLANRVANAVEQSRSKRALEASQKRLSLFVEQSPLGVIEWDENFDIVRLNDAAEAILGYTEDELVGKTWEAIVPDADKTTVSDVVVELLDGTGGYHSINENVRKTGETIVCEWHNRIVTDENGDVVAIFSQFQDITERKNQQRELERHRTIIQAATNTIITVDEMNTILSANPSVERTFGYDADELVGEPLTVLMSDEMAEKHTAAFERYLETDERTLDWTDIEFEGQHRDGSPIPLLVTFGEVTYEGKRYFVGILRDRTDRKERERKLEETNVLKRQNERLEEFANVVSHDLRNPLNVATARLELLSEECHSDHVAPIERAHTRMNDLVDDLLALARYGNSLDETEPVDLAELTRSCWQTVETADATLVVDVTCQVVAERSRLRQLLENLFRNSVEHSSTSSRTQPDDSVEPGREAVTVTVGELDGGFYVEDTGPGIPQADRETVFDVGYSTTSRGSGFGLSIVEQVTDAHGWDISVSSSSEGGARFEITGVECIER